MSVPHPSSVRRLRDLSVDYLVAHKIARLLPPAEEPLHDRFLDRQLAEVVDLRTLLEKTETLADSAFVLLQGDPGPLERALALLPRAESDADPDFGPWEEATCKLLLEAVGEEAHDPEIPIERQLPAIAETYRRSLALARHGARCLAGDRSIELPAPPLARPEIPSLGRGPIEIVEIGDLQDPDSARGSNRAHRKLADLPVSWRWMHGPTGRHEQSEAAAGLAEIALEAAPTGFWEAISLLYRTYALGERGLISEISGIPKGGVDALFLALNDHHQQKVRRDMAMVNVCAVPPIRPAFVIGTKPFLGLDALDDLRAEVERLAKGS